MIIENGSELLIAKIKQVLEQVRPVILNDGGDIEFVKFEDGIVYITMHGACVGCPMSAFTLKLGIEEALKAQIPEVTGVVSVEE